MHNKARKLPWHVCCLYAAGMSAVIRPDDGRHTSVARLPYRQHTGQSAERDSSGIREGSVASEIWTIRGVAEDVRKLASERAKAQRMTLGEWVAEAVRAHAAAKVEAPEPVQLDLVELVERVKRLEQQMAAQTQQEGRQTVASAPEVSELAKAPEPRQDAPKAARKGDRVPKLKPDQEAAARIMAEVEASGTELFVPAPSGDPAGRRLTEAGEAVVRRLYAVMPSLSGVARLTGANRATVKRVVEGRVEAEFPGC